MGRVGSLRETVLRAHLEEVQENRTRVSDRKLVANLANVDHSYSAILGSMTTHRITENASRLMPPQKSYEARLSASPTLSEKAPDFARAFNVRLVEQTAAPWEFWFGLLQQYVERNGHPRVPKECSLRHILCAGILYSTRYRPGSTRRDWV